MTLLLTQMAIILLITVSCGWMALKVGQARVIGEIIGGILIGPSVFGRFAPHYSARLFPAGSFGPFETLSTVGLVLFLFLIGMELDYEQLSPAGHGDYGQRDEYPAAFRHGRPAGPLPANPELTLELLGVVVAGALLSAAATDKIGVHPLFGAFLAGVCFPRVPHWQLALRERLDMLVSVLLLPLFFALTGMRTRLDLLNDTTMWLWAAVVLLAAVFGKMGGAVLAARWTGQSWRDAVALGALLNTRGLVELIVLNIAYSVGAFTPTLFTMLVVMALITTMLTTPILSLLGIRGTAKKQSGSVPVSVS